MLTTEKIIRVEKYLKRYGKDWTGKQVAAFYVAVAKLCAPVVVKAGSADG